MEKLPALIYEDLVGTRDYLQDVALAVGSFQRGFLPKESHFWQYGLEVGLRGAMTQPLNIDGAERRVLLDMVKAKVRLGDINWSLYEYDGAEIFNNLRVWLQSRNITAKLETPEFRRGRFDREQQQAYGEALWWMDQQFRVIKAGLKGGLISPILLYPHHFDLALSWFPFDDKRQLTLGWSTGDETIPEPYVYLTAYPKSESFTKLSLPTSAYWQKEGFSGAILRYRDLADSDDPAALLREFAGLIQTAKL